MGGLVRMSSKGSFISIVLNRASGGVYIADEGKSKKQRVFSTVLSEAN